jgi:RNA polymerase sigma factor (TIGR02999 family)
MAVLAANGDPVAQNLLAAALYEELHELARRRFTPRRFVGSTLQPTAIVNEAFARMLGRSNADPRSRSHFLATAATIMRGVVVDHARARNARKRGGGMRKIQLSAIGIASTKNELDAVALDDLLKALSKLCPRTARVVEMRVFAGMTVPETAAALGVSERTIKGDWRTATAWLRAELQDTL